MEKMDMGIKMIEKLQEEMDVMKRMLAEMAAAIMMLTLVTESSIRDIEGRLKDRK